MLLQSNMYALVSQYSCFYTLICIILLTFIYKKKVFSLQNTLLFHGVLGL